MNMVPIVKINVIRPLAASTLESSWTIGLFPVMPRIITTTRARAGTPNEANDQHRCYSRVVEDVYLRNLYLVALVAAVALVALALVDVALVAVAPVDLGLECSYLKCGLVCGVEV